MTADTQGHKEGHVSGGEKAEKEKKDKGKGTMKKKNWRLKDGEEQSCE